MKKDTATYVWLRKLSHREILPNLDSYSYLVSGDPDKPQYLLSLSLILFSCQDTKSWSQLFYKKKKKKNAFLNQGFPGEQEQLQHSLATLSWLADNYFWPFMLNLQSSWAKLPV